jgi:hypothetical protein
MWIYAPWLLSACMPVTPMKAPCLMSAYDARRRHHRLVASCLHVAAFPRLDGQSRPVDGLGSPRTRTVGCCAEAPRIER